MCAFFAATNHMPEGTETLNTSQVASRTLCHVAACLAVTLSRKETVFEGEGARRAIYPPQVEESAGWRGSTAENSTLSMLSEGIYPYPTVIRMSQGLREKLELYMHAVSGFG